MYVWMYITDSTVFAPQIISIFATIWVSLSYASLCSLGKLGWAANKALFVLRRKGIWHSNRKTKIER